MTKKKPKAAAPAPAELRTPMTASAENAPITVEKLRAYAGTLAAVYQLLPVTSVVENGTTKLVPPQAEHVVLARQYLQGLYADLAEAVTAAEQAGANGADEAHPAQHPESGGNRQFN